MIMGIIVLGASVYCIQKIKMSMVKTTDLSQIEIDGISVGENVSLLDLNKYTETDGYNPAYRYRFDELVLDTDDEDSICYIYSRFDENKTDIMINSIDTSQSIDDITRILGNNFYEKNQDREQMLKKHIYYDRINNITAEFIYADFGDDSSKYNNKLCWIRIFRI